MHKMDIPISVVIPITLLITILVYCLEHCKHLLHIKSDDNWAASWTVLMRSRDNKSIQFQGLSQMVPSAIKGPIIAAETSMKSVRCSTKHFNNSHGNCTDRQRKILIMHFKGVVDHTLFISYLFIITNHPFVHFNINKILFVYILLFFEW